MALKEQDIVFTGKDTSGNTIIHMPITRAANVEDLTATCLPLSGGNVSGNLTVQGKNVVRSVNGTSADASGNVTLTVSASGSSIGRDSTPISYSVAIKKGYTVAQAGLLWISCKDVNYGIDVYSGNTKLFTDTNTITYWVSESGSDSGGYYESMCNCLLPVNSGETIYVCEKGYSVSSTSNRKAFSGNLFALKVL